MKLLDEEQRIRQEIFDYFGYKEDWKVLPFDDGREFYWFLDGDEVRFNPSKVDLLQDDNDTGYSNVIWNYRHLPKQEYRGEKYTMLIVDTQTDDNKFLQIFDNTKKIEK